MTKTNKVTFQQLLNILTRRVDELKKYRDYKNPQDPNIFRIRAYNNVIQEVKSSHFPSEIITELKTADVVHIRCPANISLLAVIVLFFISKPNFRWIKYAGNWSSYNNEAWSYKLQRWILQTRWHRGNVTVNGSWPGQPDFVKSFYNPCLTD